MMQQAETHYFPPAAESWEQQAPAATGWHDESLEAAFTFAGDHHSTALLLVQGGRIVAERYWKGWTPRSAALVASAQKSVTAVLTGIALDDGRLRLDDAVSTYIGYGWSQTDRVREARITVRHLLTMTSGLDDTLVAQAEPGAVWLYNTPAYYRLKAVIQEAAGMPFADYFRTRLAEPIGMADSTWQGEMLAPPPGQQLHASARDMARFGLLILRGGRWGETKVLGDHEYLRAMLSSSQPLNDAYGYLWWLNGEASHLHAADQRIEGPLVPSAPPDLVCVFGAGHKRIYVCPSLDLVCVRHGGPAMDPSAGPIAFDEALWQRLMAAARS